MTKKERRNAKKAAQNVNTNQKHDTATGLDLMTEGLVRHQITTNCKNIILGFIDGTFNEKETRENRAKNLKMIKDFHLEPELDTIWDDKDVLWNAMRDDGIFNAIIANASTLKDAIKNAKPIYTNTIKEFFGLKGANPFLG